jgi:chromosome segregation ATPase
MDSNINLDKVSKELGRVGQATQQLQGNDQNAKGKLVMLEEAKQMTDTRLDMISNDVAATKEIDKKLQDTIDRKVNEDLRSMRQELTSTNLTVNQVVTEQKATANFSRENRDALRDVRADVEKVLNEVKKANTVTNILENRLASTAKGLQQSWTKCSELSDTMVKLTECYDKTRARVIDAEGVMKDINTAGKRTQQELEQAVRQVEQNGDRLTQFGKLIDEEVSATEDARHQINALKQGQANSLRQVNNLRSELSEMKLSTSAMRGAIKEQSSMLLPNIHLDSQAAADASARYGSMLTSSNMSTSASSGRPQSRGTPRGAGGAASTWT